MKQQSFNIKDHISEAFRDEIDKFTYPGWLNFTTMPLLYAKSIALDSYTKVASAIRNGDDRSLSDVGLGGCLFWLTDRCLNKLKQHEQNTIASSVGTSMLNGNNTIITVAQDSSFFFMTGPRFYENDVSSRSQFVEFLKERRKSTSVVKFVVPYFESDMTDYDTVLDQILTLSLESDLRIITLFVNLGTPITVDNQPFN